MALAPGPEAFAAAIGNMRLFGPPLPEAAAAAAAAATAASAFGELASELPFKKEELLIKGDSPLSSINCAAAAEDGNDAAAIAAVAGQKLGIAAAAALAAADK